MAEVDFGDSELFQQLDDSPLPVPTHIRFTSDEEEQEETRSRLEECDEHIQRLTEENKGLRRQLNILTRPSGISIEDDDIDGPALQILYTNNTISKLCRQEIEDCIYSVLLKHQKPSNEKKNSVFQVKPQNSAFAMDEDLPKSSSSCIKTTTEAFKVVGSVLYFTTFSVDRLGQPLVNENPQQTDGWDIPTYHQVFNQVIGTDGQDIEMKDKRPKSMCFNCGVSGHQLRDCPKPKDMAAINERRKEFNQNSNQSMQSNQRYHADEVEERFAKYKPGVMSEELLTALGLDDNTLPPLIYRMRQLGYPPGWLKEAEMENSGLTMYDGKAPNDGNLTDNTNSQNISYDVSKLVEFPGFNVPASEQMKDEFMQYGSVPMQTNHLKQNYGAYLSKNFPKSGATSNKRRHESESSPQQRKKTRSSPDRNSDRSSDMDIESDPGTPYNPGQDNFQFQPPLPPGSPCFSSPPPLPRGTPPATPTPPPLPKGTPPPTPTNGSPALRRHKCLVVDDTEDGTEDELTLEELEEQQRLIWAALENADTATNSDCETPAAGTPLTSSPSVPTPAYVSTQTEVVEEAMDTTRPAETCHGSKNQEIRSTRPEPIKAQEGSPQSPGPIKAQDDSPQSPGPIKAQDDSPQSPGPVKAQDVSPQSPGPVKAQDVSPQSPGPVKAQDVSPQSPGPVKAQDVSPQSPGPVKAQDVSPQSPGPVKAQDVSPQSPDPVKAQDVIPQSPDPVKAQDVIPQSPGPVKCKEDNPQSPDPDFSNDERIKAVPHRSKFAAGIVQFEDTPEFTEVAEATGTYLRIRDLLKSSPRSLSKKK
ncbi:zinc finger CCHC domain-containing protein 8 [Anoplopoma fimbria]|uniref:zinc finger CCHC domain-containing protein 8 n=1 Tax=Anoplopoma fimbria TaxID=229290 RepID=UPI0023EC8EA3|nr:zinc finger CCHC domain-containing protein 8 [Anoplopoma fimbria]